MIKKIIMKLKQERIAQKLTMKELSEKCSVSIKHICDIENLKVTPTLETLEKLAIPLGVNINVVVSKEDKPA